MRLAAQIAGHHGMNRIRRIHLVGIGGTGMSGIAEVLLNLGYQVSGSDLGDNASTRRLAGLGARIFQGHAADHVTGAEVLVVSSAVNRSNEEVDGLQEELVDRFGNVPEEVQHLLEVIKVKILLTRLAIKKLEERPSQLILTFDESTKVSPKKIVELIRHGEGRYQMTPDSRLIVEGGVVLRQDPLGTAKKVLQALA